MPGKSPQQQVLCPSGYLVPKAFETEHEKKMGAILAQFDDIHFVVRNDLKEHHGRFEELDWEDYDHEIENLEPELQYFYLEVFQYMIQEWEDFFADL